MPTSASSKLLIFDANGSEIINKRFPRNTFATAMSDDGKLGGCLLANPNSRFVLFDLSTKSQLSLKNVDIDFLNELPINVNGIVLKLNGMYNYAIVTGL